MQKQYTIKLVTPKGEEMEWVETGQGIFEAMIKTMELVVSAYPDMGWEIVKVEKNEK